MPGKSITLSKGNIYYCVYMQLVYLRIYHNLSNFSMRNKLHNKKSENQTCKPFLYSLTYLK